MIYDSIKQKENVSMNIVCASFTNLLELVLIYSFFQYFLHAVCAFADIKQ